LDKFNETNTYLVDSELIGNNATSSRVRRASCMSAYFVINDGFTVNKVGGESNLFEIFNRPNLSALGTGWESANNYFYK
jgi:hypothetical protein